MRWIPGFAAALALLATGRAVAADAPPAAEARAPAPLEATSPASDRGNKMREVRIDPNAKLPECKRYVPTGSRIATERCETPKDELTPAERADRDTLRRDINEMRALQTLRDQARDQARAEALRRAAGSR